MQSRGLGAFQLRLLSVSPTLHEQPGPNSSQNQRAAAYKENKEKHKHLIFSHFAYSPFIRISFWIDTKVRSKPKPTINTIILKNTTSSDRDHVI